MDILNGIDVLGDLIPLRVQWRVPGCGCEAVGMPRVNLIRASQLILKPWQHGSISAAHEFARCAVGVNPPDRAYVRQQTDLAAALA
jgi:hypothetical protein